MKFSKTIIIAVAIMVAVTGCAQMKKMSKAVKVPTIKEKPQPAYSICADCLLLERGQSALHASPDTIKGLLEGIHVMGDKVQFQGWAADVGISGPVEKILIFADDRIVYEGSAILERLDVAKDMSDGGLLRSGFSVILDKSLFVNADGGDVSINIYAVSKDNTAAKLPFKKQ